MEQLKIEMPTLGESIEFYQSIGMTSSFAVENISKNMYDIPILQLKAMGYLDTLVFSFKKEGTIVAIMEGHMYMNRDSPMIYLRHLVVHPDYRRNGYGTQAFMLFVKFFIENIKGSVPQKNWHLHIPQCIELIVESDDPIKFWQSLGFYEIPIIEGDEEHERRFRLDLEYNEKDLSKKNN